MQLKQWPTWTGVLVVLLARYTLTAEAGRTTAVVGDVYEAGTDLSAPAFGLEFTVPKGYSSICSRTSCIVYDPKKVSEAVLNDGYDDTDGKYGQTAYIRSSSCSDSASALEALAGGVTWTNDIPFAVDGKPANYSGLITANLTAKADRRLISSFLEDPISGVAVRIGVVGGSNLTALLALNRAVLANLTLNEPLAIDSARDFNVTYGELLSSVDVGRPIVRTVRNPTGGTGTITQYKFFDDSTYEKKFTGINTGIFQTTTGTWGTVANCIGLQPDNDDSYNILTAYYPADSMPNPSSRTRGLLYLGSDLYLVE